MMSSSRRYVAVPGIDSVDEYVVAITFGFVDSGVGEKLPNKFLAVGAMIGQRLTGPFPRHEHSAAGQPERAATVCLPFALAGNSFRAGSFRHDATAQPDRAPLRAWRDSEFGVQPIMVRLLSGSVGLEDFANRLGEVFSQVADVTRGFLCAAEHALRIDLFPEADHACRPGFLVVGQRF